MPPIASVGGVATVFKHLHHKKILSSILLTAVLNFGGTIFLNASTIMDNNDNKLKYKSSEQFIISRYNWFVQ